MERRETERILEAIRDVRAAGERAAIATVVRVTGSAYRREGTRILVRQDGSYECLLSGGCLEPAVADAAARVIASGVPVVASYDLEEDSVWGLGIGCSGAVDIRIERLEDDPLTTAWLDVLERGDGAVRITPLSGPSGRLIVADRGTIGGSLDDPTLESAAAARALQRLRSSHPHSGPETIGSHDLFFEISLPPPRLIVFGAGADVPPLAEQAWQLGFDVTVVDVRAAFLTPERFPRATRVAAHFSQFARALTLDARSFVVIMNHHLERDSESLRFALGSAAPYIGLLGPRSRYRKLIAALHAGGGEPDPAALARVRSPIGLALGAESPEEIALSILGEIVAIRRGFDAGFLSGTEASLHRPADTRSFARS
jgi:xanthine/CO dehydrogenase XdhC/CoxF family maturation factor